MVSPKEGLASIKLAKIRHMRKEITRLMKEDAQAQSKETKTATQKSRRTLSRFSTLDHKSFTKTSMQFGQTAKSNSMVSESMTDIMSRGHDIMRTKSQSSMLLHREGNVISPQPDELKFPTPQQ